MSRVGRRLIPIPKGVDIKHEGETVTVKGPKGTLAMQLISGIGFSSGADGITLTRVSDEGRVRAFHGLMRALLANNIQGVSEGFKRELDIVGVGYRAEVKGRDVVFQLGYSHPIKFPIPDGIEITVEPKTFHMVITGADKQKVGQIAAEIRSLRPPDPYKGKGIKYTAEVIRRKAGKAAGK